MLTKEDIKSLIWVIKKSDYMFEVRKEKIIKELETLLAQNTNTRWCPCCLSVRGPGETECLDCDEQTEEIDK